MVYASVQEIIYSLKLVDYLPIQRHNHTLTLPLCFFQNHISIWKGKKNTFKIKLIIFFDETMLLRMGKSKNRKGCFDISKGIVLFQYQ